MTKTRLATMKTKKTSSQMRKADPENYFLLDPKGGRDMKDLASKVSDLFTNYKKTIADTRSPWNEKT